MAARLGISVSYLSQIENDARPLTPPVLAALARHHPLDLDAIQAGQPERRFTALHAALADPIFAETRVSPDNLARIVEQQPDFADRFLLLHDAYRRAEDNCSGQGPCRRPDGFQTMGKTGHAFAQEREHGRHDDPGGHGEHCDPIHSWATYRAPVAGLCRRAAGIPFDWH